MKIKVNICRVKMCIRDREYPEAVPDGMIPAVLYLGKLNMKSGRGEGCFTFDWNNVKYPRSNIRNILISVWISETKALIRKSDR